MSQDLKQSMVDGGVWAVGGRLVAIAGAFVLNLALARSLAPVDYGIYFVVMSTMIILATVATAGMDLVVVRFAAARKALGDWAGVRGVVARCIAVVVASTTLLCAVVHPLVPWFFGRVLAMPAVVPLAGLLVAWLLVSTLQRQLAESFRALGDIRCATLFGGFRNNGILVSGITCCLAVALWLLGAMTLATALAMTVAASLVVVLLAARTLHRRLGRSEALPDGPAPASAPVLSGLLHEAWPLWLVGLIAVMRAQGSGWFAAGFDSADQVALFAIAQRFVMLLTAPLAIVNALLPPVVAGLHARGELPRLERVVQAVGGLASLPCILIFVAIAVAGRPALGLLFGAHYEAAYPMLLVLCVAQIANVVTGAWQIVLPMTGHRRQMLRVSLIAVSTQLGCSLVGGSVAGAFGVALGACAGIVAGNVLGVLAVRRTLGIWTFISIRPAILVEAVALLSRRMSRLLPARARGA